MGASAQDVNTEEVIKLCKPVKPRLTTPESFINWRREYWDMDCLGVDIELYFC
jgi:hypothetical protein